jgi:hypothetical protein
VVAAVSAVRTAAGSGAFDAGAERDLEVAQAPLHRTFAPIDSSELFAARTGMRKYNHLVWVGRAEPLAGNEQDEPPSIRMDLDTVRHR